MGDVAVAKEHALTVSKEATEKLSSDDPKLVFRFKGMPMAVAYTISASAQACHGFVNVIRVLDNGRGTLLP
ncbi:hypothetical protein C9I56_35355 [Paraburkholderia caribensis]|nr:hypothetical protein C9I56_35355 [Paraburkholderia caribensis]